MLAQHVDRGLCEGLFLQPVGIAAGFPFAEVLFLDGLASEVALEDGLDLGKTVEPGDEANAGDAIADATGQLIADFFGQPPDFTGMRARTYFHAAIFTNNWKMPKVVTTSNF